MNLSSVSKMPRRNDGAPTPHRPPIPKPSVRDRETMANQEEEEDEEASPSCFPLLTYTCSKQPPTGANLSDLHDTWRESQRSTAVQISRQLKCKWALDSLIETHLSRLRVHYTCSMVPSCPADVPRLLIPSWDPPLATAALSWLGDMWRPSSLLSLIVPTISTPLATKPRRLLNEVIRRLRIQEAVLDEEMAEYQSMSVLNLMRPRATARGRAKKGGKVEAVRSEMKKIEGVIERAQRIRYRAVEVAVKGGILDESQGAEFLVALAGIQEAVRRQAAKWRTKAGVVSIQVQAFDVGGGS